MYLPGASVAAGPAKLAAEPSRPLDAVAASHAAL